MSGVYGSVGRRMRSPVPARIDPGAWGRIRRRTAAQELHAERPTLEAISDPEYLILVAEDMREAGDTAPGPDRRPLSAYGRREVAETARVLSMLIRQDAYRPGPYRRIVIPKASGGTRTLAIANVFDCVVARALNLGLTPLWEREYLPMSYGFRPGRGPHQMLADLIARMTVTGHHVLAVDDVRTAFDAVRLDDVWADHDRYIADTELRRLIQTVLEGGRRNPTHGLLQGNPYSPTALNLRLHHVHDLRIAEDRAFPSAHRYADNLAYVCADVSEAQHALDRVGQWLREGGLALKGADGPPADLDRTDHRGTSLLGFTVHRVRDRIGLGIAAGAWIRLDDALLMAQDAVDPPQAAKTAAEGWVTAYGPGLEGSVRSTAIDRVLSRCARSGYRETISRDRLIALAEETYRRWETTLAAALHSLITSGSSPDRSGGSAARHPTERA